MVKNESCQISGQPRAGSRLGGGEWQGGIFYSLHPFCSVFAGAICVARCHRRVSVLELGNDQIYSHAAFCMRKSGQDIWSRMRTARCNQNTAPSRAHISANTHGVSEANSLQSCAGSFFSRPILSGVRGAGRPRHLLVWPLLLEIVHAARNNYRVI